MKDFTLESIFGTTSIINYRQSVLNTGLMWKGLKPLEHPSRKFIFIINGCGGAEPVVSASEHNLSIWNAVIEELFAYNI
jgi:hypothetical protein